MVQYLARMQWALCSTLATTTKATTTTITAAATTHTHTQMFKYPRSVKSVTYVSNYKFAKTGSQHSYNFLPLLAFLLK